MANQNVKPKPKLPVQQLTILGKNALVENLQLSYFFRGWVVDRA